MKVTRYIALLVCICLPAIVCGQIQFDPPIDANRALNFQDTPVNQQSNMVIVARNGGNAQCTIRFNAPGAPFAINPMETDLPGGAQAIFNLTFSPEEEGDFRSQLSGIAIFGMAIQRIGGATLNGTGVAGQQDEPEIWLDPEEVDVEIVREGNFIEFIVMVGNRGEAVLGCEIEQADADWLDVDPLRLSVDPGEQEELTLMIGEELPDNGEYETSFIISSNDPDRPEVEVPVYLTVDIPEFVRQVIQLRAGWQMVSLNVIPGLDFWAQDEDRGPDVILMWEQLRLDEDRHNVFLIKNGRGRFYAPHIPFNNIDFWDLQEGYWIRVVEDAEAVFEGIAIDPHADMSIPDGWSIIPYYPSYDLPMTSPEFYAIRSIIDHVFVIKNDRGRFAAPGIPFSNLDVMTPGVGYQIRIIDGPVEFNYPPEPDEEEVASRRFIEGEECPIVTPTSENMSVLVSGVSGIEIREGSQIRAYSTTGSLVGAGYFDEQDRCGLAVWGDDPTTAEIDGMLRGEAFSLRLWDCISETEVDLNTTEISSGELTYGTNGFTVLEVGVSAPVPAEFHLSNAFPNPFNAATRITYRIPDATVVTISVMDISGRLVQTLVDGEKPSGTHAVTWDAHTETSGVYFIRLETAGFKSTRKLVLIN